jgi:BASS family bile acid:Na+ symporter
LLNAIASRLNRHATGFMAGSVVVGLIWQDLARWLAPLVLYASMITIFISAVRLDERLLVHWLKRPALPIMIVLWTTLILPAVALGLVLWLPLPPSAANALLLIAATAPIISVGTYCLLLGTDTELLSLSVLPATALSIFTLPAFAAVIGLPGLDPSSMALTLLGVVGVSLGGALLVRTRIPFEAVGRLAAPLDILMLMMVAVVAIGVTDGLRAVLLESHALVLYAALVAFAINVLQQGLTAAVFSLFQSRRIAASVALVAGFRNMALLLGLTLGRVDRETQLILVAGQLMLFLLPWPMRRVYTRYGVAAQQPTSAPGPSQSPDHRGGTSR